MNLIGFPTVTIGHLDDEGLDILDRKLKENLSIEEIIAFFSNYKPKLLQLKISKSRSLEIETTSDEFSTSESFTMEIENNTKREMIEQNQSLHHPAKATLLTPFSPKIEKEMKDGEGYI